MKYSIKVNEVRAKEGSNIKGFATVVFGDSFKITNIAILENKDKGELFVSMPRYRSNERDESNGVIYKDVCNPNQKLKVYYLAKIMVNNTDDEYAMTLQDIKNALEQYEITADRKSLYDDFNVLRDMGIDILGEQRGRSYYYHVGKKKFELAELKLLVDAIQSSKFITVKKSHELIRKLESFASRYEASKLQRQVVVTGRIKTMNECIYYNVDAIHSAIANNRMIQFWIVNTFSDKFF